ncbi:MAG: hypothetical protein QXJ64_09315, partial [Thermosphaera sp.]
MAELDKFLMFFRTYFRGPTGAAELREVFIAKGDLKTTVVRERWEAFIRGVDLVLREFIKRLEEWNVFMGVGFTAGHWEITPSVIQYDRLAYDFDSEEDPAGAANTALAFAKAVEKEFGAVGIVFVTGFKGAHVVI